MFEEGAGDPDYRTCPLSHGGTGEVAAFSDWHPWRFDTLTTAPSTRAPTVAFRPSRLHRRSGAHLGQQPRRIGHRAQEINVMMYVIVECDYGGCVAHATGPNLATVRKGAKREGWTFRADGATFCPKHLSETTSRCAECGKKHHQPPTQPFLSGNSSGSFSVRGSSPNPLDTPCALSSVHGGAGRSLSTPSHNWQRLLPVHWRIFGPPLLAKQRSSSPQRLSVYRGGPCPCHTHLTSGPTSKKGITNQLFKLDV